MDKYQHYEDASCGLLSELQAFEVTASKHLSEPIAVDPKNLQRQLEETKVKRERGQEPNSLLSLTENISFSYSFVIVSPESRTKNEKSIFLPLERVITLVFSSLFIF